MSTAPRAKRRRVSTRTAPIRDPKLYFADGNIVLSAPDAPKGSEQRVYFRVHKSILANASIVFGDLFQIPTPASSEGDSYDGAALVVLHDSADYLRSFLQAIYDPLPTFLSPYEECSIDFLIGAYVLAKKYEASALRDHIITVLKVNWPGDDYYEWKRSLSRQDECRSIRPEQLIHFSRSADARDELRDSLVMAYYQLSCSPPAGFNHKLLTVEDCLILISGRSEMLRCLSLMLKGESNEQFEPLRQCPHGQCAFQATFKSNLTIDVMGTTAEDDLLGLIVRKTKGEDLETLNELETFDYSSCACSYENTAWLYGLAEQLYGGLSTFFTLDPLST